jgi:hypothetical protein
MGRSIVKLGDYYLMWSTVVDAPVTYGMKLDEFKDWYLKEYGRSGMLDLEDRLDRVEEAGTSALDEDIESLLSGNRAGDDEEELTLDELYRRYCLREDTGKGKDDGGDGEVTAGEEDAG